MKPLGREGVDGAAAVDAAEGEAAVDFAFAFLGAGVGPAADAAADADALAFPFPDTGLTSCIRTDFTAFFWLDIAEEEVSPPSTEEDAKVTPFLGFPFVVTGPFSDNREEGFGSDELESTRARFAGLGPSFEPKLDFLREIWCDMLVSEAGKD